MPRLRWCSGYLAAARNTLVGRQRSARLDLPNKQIESPLRVRLNQFELRECRGRVLVGFDVVTILYLVQPVRRREIAASISLVALAKCSNGRNVARIRASVMIDR